MNSLRQAARVAAGFLTLVALGTLAFHAAGNRPRSHENRPAPSSRSTLQSHYGNLPLSFEPNAGQAKSGIQFLSRGQGYTLMLSGDEALLAMKRHAPDGASSAGFEPGTNAAPNLFLDMQLAGANPQARPRGVDELPGRSNYFIGNDPSHWRVNLANYGAVRYNDIYPGINLFYYGNQGRLEYDFVVAPGASAAPIAWSFGSRNQGSASHGASVRRIDANGDMVLGIDGSEIRFSKPTAYQLPRQVPESLVMGNSGRSFSVDGAQRTTVESRWVLRPGGLVGFATGAYDHSRPLVIDPSLVYSTFLGGSNLDEASAIAVDSAGNAYVTGGTISTNFPLAGASLQTQCMDCAAGEPNVFVSKLNADGSALIYSTYLGGTGYSYGYSGDRAYGIAVDAEGNAYLTGVTDSGNFPVTTGALKTDCPSCRAGSTNAFVTKLNPSGSALVFSTYLGGSGNSGGIGDWAHALAVDASGNVYVTGQTYSKDFPTSTGAFQRVCNGCAGGTAVAFVSKLKADGSALLYSTMLGGSNGASGDTGFAIAVDGSGNAFVGGQAGTQDFPFTPGAFQTTLGNAGTGGFVTKLNADGSALVYSTFLVGTMGTAILDLVQGIALDAQGSVYAVGSTTALNFPTTTGAFQTTVCQNCTAGNSVGFVSKLTADGTGLIFSTLLGGSGGDQANGIAIDSNGNSYVVGETKSSDFPFTSDARQTQCDQSIARCVGDAFVTELNASGTALIYSTYLGGSNEDAATAVALDSANNIYVAGYTVSPNFPVTTGALQPTCGDGNCIPALPGNPNPYDAFIAKFGTATVVSAPKVTLAPASLAFGNQAVGTASSPQPITLTNAGNAALTSLAISITGANSSDFSQTNTCGTTVTAGASCTISVTFTPSASGSRAASVQISDNAAASPQSVALTGSGTSAGAPSVALSPVSIAFGNQAVGTASSPQPITLTNAGNAVLTSLTISITGANSGDFSQTNTCGTTVTVGASCTISVTFTPSASGSRAASVQISDNAAASPQSVALTGSGTAAALGLTIAPGSSATATITAGSTATYNLSLGGKGFSGTVTLSCSGAPQKSACTVPGSVSVSATTASAVQVTVSTTASSVAQLARPVAAPLVLGTPVLALLCLPRRIRRKASLQILGMLAVAVAVLSLSGCGATGNPGGTGTGGGKPGTPSGTYTLTVSASGGLLTESAQLTLNVQ